MTFLYPNMLWCLFLLLIPIIIHLFNFRRHKVVYFSNTSTLKTIEQENAKTKKLKYIITLIMRMLFIASLVIAFAYPYNPDKQLKADDAGNLMAVYIDNSMSMQSQSEEISIIEDARASARMLVKSVSPSQRFVLLTNSRHPDDEYPMNRDEMLMNIDGMQTEASPMSVNALYENLQMIMRRNGFKTSSLFMYSDFQTNMMDLEGIKADSAIQIVMMPLKSDFQKNVYIDTAWLASPILQTGLANEINVSVVNESEREIKGLPVDFVIDDKAVAFTTVDIQANGRNDVSMQFVLDAVQNAVSNTHLATVSINDFPITFDDKYNFVLDVRPVIKVVELTASSEKSPIGRLFSDESQFDYKAVDPYRIDQQYLADCQMVVADEDINETMRQSLLDFASNGGSVLFVPSVEAKTEDDTLNVSMVASQHEFFDDVFVRIPENADLPKVFRHSQINKKQYNNALSLISMQNGEPFFVMSRKGQGNVFMLATRLSADWTNFADNAMFVPVMYKIAMMGSCTDKLSYTIGIDKDLFVNDLTAFSEGDVRMRDIQNTFEMIPMVEMRNNRAMLRLFDELPGAGFYTVNKGEEVISTTAWNDNRKESVMKFVDRDDLSELFKDKGLNVLMVMKSEEIRSGDVMAMMVRKSMLWRTFIIIALITLLIEILILRFWK